MNKQLLWLLFIGFALQLVSCWPYEEALLTNIDLNYRDKQLQKIYSFQNEAISDSLYPYFRDKDPTYRYAAALAFASHQDSTAIDSLTFLLKDPIDEVRAAAAYAIGQIGSLKGESRLIQAFDQQDTLGQFRQANRAILEAVGKCGSTQSLSFISTIKTYNAKDTALVEGQALAIYRFGLRNEIDTNGTKRMIQMVSNTAYPFNARLFAANYLYRMQNLRLAGYETTLAQSLFKEPDARIRMALVIALGKTQMPTALDALKSQFNLEKDYRVRCNILTALGNFPYEEVQDLALSALRDNKLPVAERASSYFLTHGDASEATSYWRLAKDTLPWQVQMNLYQAANRHLPYYFEEYKGYINSELRRKYSSSTNIYEKMAVFQALAESGWNYRYIYREGMDSEQKPIQTASIRALSSISRNPNFYQAFSGSSRRVERDLASHFMQAIRTLDDGMVAEASIALRNDQRSYKTILADSIPVLDSILNILELPRQVEAYNELKNSISYLKGVPFTPSKLSPNRPIDWQQLEKLTPIPTAEVKTSRGDIEIELYPWLAPGTVANFIKLAREGFYDSKNFHRVVPNFVIQGGCPRGDGYGGVDYTIRSELPPLSYNEAGYVGMASAGLHTEGCQFFITHAPTLHLDGRYTIFAKVIKGLELVHQVEIGDQIETILIK